jgi:hypothetical protein
MDDYFAGALLQLLERARHLNTRVPRNLEREFHTLVTTCQAEVTRIVNTVRFLLDEPAIRLPANQPERLRMFRRAVADLDVVETVGFAAIERANKEDIKLNRLVPLTEGRFLLHLPDLFHEIGHPLLSTANNPVVEPFRLALNRVLQAAMVYLDGETRVQERRRGPSRMLFTLECWARSWVSWSVEFLCDLFGAFTVGPAFAWSHLHLSAKRGGDPYFVPALAPTSHPPDAARMTLVLKGLARCGFTTEIARIQDRWRDFIAIAESRAEPEYTRCFPDQLLDEICSAAWEGVEALGCRVASPTTNDEVYRLLNRAWEEFWRAPSGYGKWEQGAVDALFSPRPPS